MGGSGPTPPARPPVRCRSGECQFAARDSRETESCSALLCCCKTSVALRAGGRSRFRIESHLLYICTKYATSVVRLCRAQHSTAAVQSGKWRERSEWSGEDRCPIESLAPNLIAWTRRARHCAFIQFNSLCVGSNGSQIQFRRFETIATTNRVNFTGQVLTPLAARRGASLRISHSLTHSLARRPPGWPAVVRRAMNRLGTIGPVRGNLSSSVESFAALTPFVRVLLGEKRN